MGAVHWQGSNRRAIQIARVAGGKIVEIWQEIDMMGLMVQLGIVPPPGG